MNEIEELVKKVKRSRNRTKMLEALDELLARVKDENEMLRLRMIALEKERDEYKQELEEIHKSITYRVGRWISETKIGGKIKKLLWRYMKIR